jgi:hypothetical protein
MAMLVYNASAFGQALFPEAESVCVLLADNLGFSIRKDCCVSLICTPESLLSSLGAASILGRERVRVVRMWW